MDANYAAHGLTLSFAWFLVANLIASALVAAAAGRLLQNRSARPGWWLALRLAPAALSAAFVLVLFVPSYWKYEPREAVEDFNLALATIAAAAPALILISLVRGLRAWRSAGRRVRQWMTHGRLLPRATAEWQTPVFIVDADHPIIALSGIRRHRLLVTRGLVEALTAAELRAAIAHELGHRRAWDNLKRLAMRSAPDFLRFTQAARELERRWTSAAEHAADGFAGPDRADRCALASALVKVARLSSARFVRPAALLAEPISTLIGGGEIASRVERLLDDGPRCDARRALPTAIGVVGAATLAVLAYGPALRLVHDTTEHLIRLLP